jgi:hypothetical protein
MTEPSTRIDSLTSEQEEALREHHAEWYRYGTSTEPSDRPATQAAITRMYEIIGKPAPRFVWCDSPATGALAVAILSGKLTPEAGSLWGSLRGSLGGSLGGSLWGSLRGSLRDSLGDSLGGSLWGSLWGSLGDSLGGSLWGSLRGSLGGSLWDSLGDSLRDSLRDSLGDSLGGSLWGSLRDSLGDSLRDSLAGRARDAVFREAWWGQHEAFWIAYYLFPEQQSLVTYDPRRSEQLGLWATISRSTGWWFPYEGVVVCTERPIVVQQELESSRFPYGTTSRRLHCEDGPALAYRDGWAVHSWHGVRVPAWVIEDDVTPAHIDRALKLDNSEQRRAALERIGWPRVVQHLGSTPIATCPDPANAPHELALYALPAEFYDEPVNLLVMTNGSPDRNGALRLYGETVPSSITDPLAAAAWQYDVHPSVYADLARRT